MSQRLRKAAAALMVVGLPFGLAACGGGDKPSKDEIIDSFQSSLEELAPGFTEDTFKQAGLSQEDIDSYYQCIVDDSYDDLSADSWKAFMEGDADHGLTADEESAFNSAITTCSSELTDKLTGGN